jgi:hypothetical protein
MPDLTAKRTLVKSPPELWEELSEVERLAKHLGAFGEIEITKLEPEHTVAWEGEHASGTVSIEPSGWGTKVTLHAELPDERPPEPEPVAAEPEPEPVPAEPEPVAAEPEPEPPAAKGDPVNVEPVLLPEPKRRGFLGWLFRTRTAPPADALQPFANEPEPEPVFTEPEPVVARPEAEPVAVEPPEPVTVEPPPEPVTVEPPPEPVTLEPPPEPVAAESEPESPAAPASLDPERAQVVLDEALDALGAAHHRPFSRS